MGGRSVRLTGRVGADAVADADPYSGRVASATNVIDSSNKSASGYISSFVSGSPPQSRPSGRPRLVMAAISDVGECEVEDVEVLALPLIAGGFRQRDRAELSVPPQHDLTRRLAVHGSWAGDSPVVERPTLAQRAPALGHDAEVGVDRDAARSAGNSGCSSIWLTAGITPVASADFEQMTLGEVRDPDRADAASHAGARPSPATASTYLPWRGFGQWIRYRSTRPRRPSLPSNDPIVFS